MADSSDTANVHQTPGGPRDNDGNGGNSVPYKSGIYFYAILRTMIYNI